MGTEILRPQDCLIERIRVPQPAVCYRRRNYGNPNFNYPNTRSSRKPAVRQEKPEKKRYVTMVEPSVSKRSSSADDLRVAKTGPAMEKVTILRRGESLDSKIKSESRKEGGGGGGGEGLVVTSTERLGPAPEMVPKQIRIVDPRSPSPPTPPPMMRKCDMYAGSAFAMSPAPSSLPLPSFSKKKQVVSGIVVDDSATRDLRRLLQENPGFRAFNPVSKLDPDLNRSGSESVRTVRDFFKRRVDLEIVKIMVAKKKIIIRLWVFYL
nr:hypothetical protein CFP56_43990 [Quercus suber]